jgi:RimJ/RimL family protein N-acetyltransferase
LDDCRQVIEKVMGPVRLEVGVSYLIPPNLTVGRTADLVLLGGNLPRSLQSPVDHWGVEEWQLLLRGDRGPWAMATSNGRVISLCHSARLAERGAEAGTWTDPALRGRGHAAVVTAAWASLVAPSGRYLFYSTSAKNHSSQRVAERLQLRCLGLMWHLVAN